MIETIKLLKQLQYRGMRDVLSDFAMLFISQFLINNVKVIDKDKYKPDELQTLIAAVTQFIQDINTAAKQNEFQDYTSQILTEYGLFNSALGQFFTPQSVADLMSALTFDADYIKQLHKQRKTLLLYEPAAGTGRTIIAAAKQLYQILKDDYKTFEFSVIAFEIDALIWQFLTVNMIINNIDSALFLGDSLNMKCRKKMIVKRNYNALPCVQLLDCTDNELQQIKQQVENDKSVIQLKLF